MEGQKTILVLDDDPMILKSIARSFQRRFNVVTVETAEEPVNYICYDHVPCDFFLSDWDLGDGYNAEIACEAAIVERVPLIVWSGDMTRPRQIITPAWVFDKTSPIMEIVRIITHALR